MKDELIALRAKLQTEKKYEIIHFNNGVLGSQTNRKFIEEEILAGQKLAGEEKALIYFEEQLKNIVHNLSQYNIDFDEITVDILPSYFMSENNIQTYINLHPSEMNFNPELVYINIFPIKFVFSIFKDGKNMKYSDNSQYYGYTSKQSYVSQYLENLNKSQKYFYVDFEKLAKMLNDYGYTLDINTNNKLLEAQKQDNYPSVNINFAKKDEIGTQRK